MLVFQPGKNSIPFYFRINVLKNCPIKQFLKFSRNVLENFKSSSGAVLEHYFCSGKELFLNCFKNFAGVNYNRICCVDLYKIDLFTDALII